MTIRYQTTGTCSREMIVEVEEGVVRSLKVVGGCDGNLKGLSRLVAGMRAEDVVRRLEGIRCGGKATSCPDQLARALKQAL